MLEEEGFLSPHLESSIANIRQVYKVWFDLVNDVNRLAMRILLLLHADKENSQEVLSVILCARAVKSFQASVLLAERGMIANSRTVLRSSIETVIVQLKIAGQANFVDSLNERHDNHSLRIINTILRDQNFQAVMSDRDITKANTRAEKIKADYPDRKPSDINLSDLAKEVNADDLYALYRITSGDAAHATTMALERHLLIDDQGNLTTLLFEPSDRGLPETLRDTLEVCLRSLDSAIKSFALDDFRAPLEALKTRGAELAGKMFCA